MWLNDLTAGHRSAALGPPLEPSAGDDLRTRTDEDIETVRDFWLAYLEDLASLPDLKPGERTLAQAMIWERLGQCWAEEAEDECDCEECRRGAGGRGTANAADDEPGFLIGRTRRGQDDRVPQQGDCACRPVLRLPTMPWPRIMSSGSKRMPRPKFIGGS